MENKVVQIIINAVDNATQKLEGITGKLQPLEKSLKKIALVAGAAFTGLSAGIYKSVSDFGDFNAEIERAGTFINASEKELEMFKEAAINAAQGTKFSFLDMAEALGNFVGGEIDAKTASEELGGIIDLALIAKLEDLQQAVDIGATALTVFKDDGMEMADVMDIIGTVAADVTTRTDQWATALVNSAGAAKSAGFSFKDLNIMFSEMVRGGADVNLVWAAFNSAMTNIQAPTNGVMDALESVGLNIDGLNTALQSGPIELLGYLRTGFEKANESGTGFGWLANVLGRQAAPEFALALGLTNDELIETAEYFDDISGRGQIMADKIRDAIPPFEQLKQKLREISIRIGDPLSIAFMKAIDAIKPFLDKISEFISKHPQFSAGVILIITGLTGLIAILAVVGLGIIGFQSSLIVIIPIIHLLGAAFAFLISPIGLVILGIAALIAIGVLLYKNWDEIKAFAIEIWTAIKDFFVNIWEEIKAYLSETWANIKESVFEFLNWYWDIWSGIWEKVSGFFIDKWNGMKDFLMKVLKWYVDTFMNIGNTIKDMWSKVWDTVGNVVSSAFDGIKNVIKGAINWIIDKINFFIRAANKVTQMGNKLPGIDMPMIPEIPRLAKGGIVTRPTLAMVGEAGPEAVIPLKGGRGAGAVSNITININNPTVRSDRDIRTIAEQVERAIMQKVKSNVIVPV